MRKLIVFSLAALIIFFSGCNGGSKPISITITSPTGAQTLDLGQSFTIAVQLANDSKNLGATFTLSGVGALSNQSASGATYTAPAAGNGGTATVTITSAADPTKTVNITITVTPPPSISNPSSTLSTGIQGVAYSATVTTSGGAGSLTYSVTLGSLPAGLSLNSSTGAITGSPTGTGTSTFTVQVKDSSTASPQTSTKQFTITVNQQPTITSANATSFTSGVAGSFQVTVTSIPNSTITSTGTLPTGVTLHDNGNNTATLAGTTTTTGSFPITITANNGQGTAGTQAFTLTVVKAPSITSGAAATFVTGAAGTFSVTTTGYPAPGLSEAGALPAGVTFVDNHNGTATLSGTPAAGTGGKYPITITAANGTTPNATQSFVLTVNQAPAITSANTASFAVNAAGTPFTVTTTGYPTAALSESGALPAGITFHDNGNGTASIGGTPTATGTFPITITANNGVSPNATQSFSIVVEQIPAFTSANNTTYVPNGSPFTFVVSAAGYPTPKLSNATNLPTNVTFTDNGNGTANLTVNPGAGPGGVYHLALAASNAAGSVPQTFTLTLDQAPSFTSANAATFSVGVAGSFTVNTSGYPIPAITKSGALPSGVTFTDNLNGTATISGTPAAATSGTYPITLTANNGVNPNGTQTFTLTVNTAPAITSANNATFTVGSAGTFTVTTSGVPTPSLAESGSLPSGVTFTDNHNGTATLAGTPAASSGGIYSLTLTATNTVGSNNQTFTLTVRQAPTITSANSATFSVGSASSFTVTTTGTPKPGLSEAGALPSGVTFVDNGNGTATLSGTPTASGAFPITITANNGVSPNATQTFTLTVNTAPGFTSANNTTFTVGSAGTFTVTTTGTPVPSLASSGSLPSGVTFTDNHNGTATLAGTPAASTGGTYTLTLTATNTAGSNNQTFTLTVDQAPAITSANATSSTVGGASSFTVTTSGFPKPALSESGALPSGVTFVDNGNGTATLSGTPGVGTAGTYPLTITASNGVSPNATQSFTLTVNTLPVFSSGTSTTFTVGTPGTFTVSASGSPSFTETGTLPSGVTLVDNHNGTATLAGTPAATTGGVFNFTINATNGTGTAHQSFSLTVDEAPFITSQNSATFVIGQAGNFHVSAGGFPQPNISESGALPSAVSFNTSTAVLSGTPATGTAGTYPITFTASNGVGSNATQNFTLTVVLDPCAGATTGGEALLNGQYAFILKGFDAGNGPGETQPEPVLVGGVLTLNGTGTITAGTLDQNTNSSAGILSQSVTGGTYKVDNTSHRACLSVTTAAGTSHYRASLAGITGGVSSNGHMIGFDPAGPFVAGIFKKQTTSAFSTSQVTGNFVFGVGSADNSKQCTTPCKFAATGVFNLSNGNLTGGEVDTNEGGQLNNSGTTWPGSPISVASLSNAYTISSTSGRGNFAFKPSVATNNVNSIIYVVSASDAFVMAADDQTKNSLFAGEMFLQSGTPYTTHPLSGNYAGYLSGLGSTASGSKADLILVNFSGSNLTGTQYETNSGTFQLQALTGITYSVTATGRMTVTGGGQPPIFRLVNANQFFLLGGDNQTQNGIFQAQTNTSAPSGLYAFGEYQLDSSFASDSSGSVILASPNVNVTEDKNANGTLTVGGTNSTTFSVDSTGLGTLPAGCSVTAVPTTCNTIFLTITSTQFAVLDTGSATAKVQLVDH